MHIRSLTHAAACVLLAGLALATPAASGAPTTAAQPGIEAPVAKMPLAVASTPGQQFTDVKLSWSVDEKWRPTGTTFFAGRKGECPGGGGYLYAVCSPYGVIRCAPILHGIKAEDNSQVLAQAGVTHLEESGTGGAPEYGNLRLYLLPDDGNIPDPKKPALLTSHRGNGGSEMVSEFKTPAVRWSTTAGHAAVIHRLEPLGKDRFALALDLGSIWGGEAGKKTNGEFQQFLGGSYRWISDTEVEVTQRQTGGWGFGGPWALHARLKFSRAPLSVGGWAADKVVKPGLRAVEDTLKRESKRVGNLWSRPEPADPAGFIAVYDQPVDVTVAISFTSPQRAAEVLARDAADGYDAVRTRAEERWRASLSRIVVEGGSREAREIFYAQWRACQLLPSDRTGDNPLWAGEAPFYDDFYTLWDTYHALNPLLTLALPRRAGHIANGLVDMAEHEGWFFDARMGNYAGRSQAGCMGEIITAEAALKKLPYVDPARTLKAVVKSATTPSPDPQALGRWDVETYWSKGYVQARFGGGSRTIEYSRTDWTIALLAKQLGDNATYEKFAKSANNWENLWNDELSDGYFKGFVWGKDAEGSWITSMKRGQVATIRNTAGTGNALFCENETDVYSLNLLHDADRLAARCGGTQKLMDRLAVLNVRYPNPKEYGAQLADPGKLLEKAWVRDGNEPDYDPIWLYHLLGRPDLTMTYMRTLNPVSGDDAGAGNARRIVAALGIYPFAGTDVYFLIAPHFPRTLIQRDDGTTLEVLAPGAEGSMGRSSKGRKVYVASLLLDGKPVEHAWVRHDELAKAKKLEFTLSDTPTQLGVGQLPPCRGRPGE